VESLRDDFLNFTICISIFEFFSLFQRQSAPNVICARRWLGPGVKKLYEVTERIYKEKIEGLKKQVAVVPVFAVFRLKTFWFYANYSLTFRVWGG